MRSMVIAYSDATDCDISRQCAGHGVMWRSRGRADRLGLERRGDGVEADGDEGQGVAEALLAAEIVDGADDGVEQAAGVDRAGFRGAGRQGLAQAFGPEAAAVGGLG